MKRQFWREAFPTHSLTDKAMTLRFLFVKAFAAVAATTLVVADAVAQSTVVNVENEAPPSLNVPPPFTGSLAEAGGFMPHRLDRLRTVPIGGAASCDVTPRAGQSLTTLDDLAWQWAGDDFGGSSTVLLVGQSRGEQKLQIEAMNLEG